ncbi:hypothetical protein K3495_g10431 [Podosphaera aphanis]|nr:hypothetical protein K3495_g10431 [Podosphaera aphanis]
MEAVAFVRYERSQRPGELRYPREDLENLKRTGRQPDEGLERTEPLSQTYGLKTNITSLFFWQTQQFLFDNCYNNPLVISRIYDMIMIPFVIRRPSNSSADGNGVRIDGNDLVPRITPTPTSPSEPSQFTYPSNLLKSADPTDLI